MRVYISGPITGHEDYMLNFRDAQERLTEQGHIAFNPAAVNSQMPDSTDYEEYMQIAMTMLSMCDAIYLLEGWEQSRGANREYGYALAKGMKITKEVEWMRLIDADLLKRNCKITGEFSNHFQGVDLITLGEVIDNQPTIKAVPLIEIYRLIAGHSNYNGDSILAAMGCITEGKEVKPIRPLEAEPVVHGEWIFGTTNNREYMKCSNCLKSQTPTGVFVYCPNCGAKMDGGSDE